MKKLFNLLVLCALALCSCETKNGSEEPQQPATNLKLKLTSKSVMEFSALGGPGEITFELIEEEGTRSAAPAQVTATTPAE